MTGKRGRKPKGTEVAEENNEQSVEEVPKKKRGRPNPKSEDKAEDAKKIVQSKSSKAEDEEKELKEEEIENDKPEVEENDQTNDDSENGEDNDIKDEDEEKEISEEVDEKPKRGRGRNKKGATKEKAPVQRRGRTKAAPKYADDVESDADEQDDKDDKSGSEFEAPLAKKPKKTKNNAKNGKAEASPKRSGRNQKKVTNYAEDSDEEVEVKPTGKRGRPAGRSKKEDGQSESKKLDKEVRVVLEHCKS